MMMRKFIVLVVAATMSLSLTSLLRIAPAYSAHTSSSNLLLGDNASFDGGTGDWTSFIADAPLSQVATPVQSGTGALAMTTGTGPENIWLGSGSGPATWTPAIVGARYTATAFVRASSQSRTVASLEAFYDSTGSPLATVWGQLGSDAPGAWIQTSPVVGIAPVGTSYVTLALVVYATATGEVHYVDDASITSTTVSPDPIHAPLYTLGNGIYGSDGARVVFRGIHRDGTQISTSRFPADDEIGQARSWGANFIRVPLNESLWINTCPQRPTNDPAYPALVDNEVSQITSRGMLALLDLHFSVTGTCSAAGMKKMADAANAPTFWSTLAKRYKTNPLVAFDLYNEPNGISDAVWLKGGTVSDGSTTFKATGMQQLYNAVRGQGASNLVFISGNTWGVWPSTKPVIGTNIVNAVHDYTCAESPPPACTAAHPYDPTPILNNWIKVGTRSPVMVTESGFPDMNNGTFNGNLINAAESKGWGWDVFAWDGTSWGLFGLVATTGSTWEPSPSGMPVLAGFAKN